MVKLKHFGYALSYQLLNYNILDINFKLNLPNRSLIIEI